MVISNEKKFIYLRVPKTGSTSVSVFLYEQLPLEKTIIRLVDRSPILYKEESGNIKYGYFDNTHNNYNITNGIHATLEDIAHSNLLHYPLEDYDIYAVCRNPVDRFLSFYNMMSKVDNVDILSSYSVFKDYMNMFEAKPQTTWLLHNNLPINKIFLYDDIVSLVSEIAKKYNIIEVSKFKDYSFRKYPPKITSIPKKALEFVQVYWASDFELYNSLTLKN